MNSTFLRGWLVPAGLGALLAASCGCGFTLAERGEKTPGIDSEFQAADRNDRESHTLSHLAALESSLSDYVKSEGKVPARLAILIPRFLSEIPSVDPAVAKHRETSEVEYYPAQVIRNGAVDGSQLRDTGKWGYVYNGRQVIIFVDCIHTSSRGRPWYKERGVF